MTTKELVRSLKRWSRASSWEALARWGQQHEAKLARANSLPPGRRKRQALAVVQEGLHARRIRARLDELARLHDTIQQLDPDLAEPLAVEDTADIGWPDDRAAAVRETLRTLKYNYRTGRAEPSTPAPLTDYEEQDEQDEPDEWETVDRTGENMTSWQEIAWRCLEDMESSP